AQGVLGIERLDVGQRHAGVRRIVKQLLVIRNELGAIDDAEILALLVVEDALALTAGVLLERWRVQPIDVLTRTLAGEAEAVAEARLLHHAGGQRQFPRLAGDRRGVAPLRLEAPGQRDGKRYLQ